MPWTPSTTSLPGTHGSPPPPEQLLQVSKCKVPLCKSCRVRANVSRTSLGDIPNVDSNLTWLRTGPLSRP